MHGAASTAVGASLHIGGSVLIVCGQTTLKVSQLIVESSSCKQTWTVVIEAGQRAPQWRSPDGRWRTQWLGSKGCSALGWAGFAVGNILRFAAMRFGAQAVLSALTSFQFIVIPIASYVLLGEEFTFAALVSIIVVLIGNGMIIATGPAEVNFTLDQLRAQWLMLHMRIFLSAMAAVLVALHAGELYVKKLEKAKHATQRDRWRARMKPNDSITFVHAMLFSAISALIGANSVLFSKSLTYIITAPWPSQLSDWYCWAVLAAFVATGGYWVRRTAVALQKFPAGLVMSVMQAFWMCQSIVAGGVYFDEFAELSGWRAVAFSAGLVAAIAGAVGMGCASFLAESHALISYTLLPGYGTDAESLLDRTRVTAYGLRFAGLADPTAGPTELQLQDLSPHSGAGRDADLEEGSIMAVPGSTPGVEQPGSAGIPAPLSRGPSGADLPKTRSLEWRDNVHALADCLGKPAHGGRNDLHVPPSASVNITASSQLRDLPPLNVALPTLSSAALPACPFELAQQHSYESQRQHGAVLPLRHQQQADNMGRHNGGGTSGTFSSRVPDGRSATAADSRVSRAQAASDSAILSQHAAAINASLVAAGSRLAAGSSGAGSGRASAQDPGSRGPPMGGGGSATASMHSASSGGGYTDGGSNRSAASTPRSVWQSPQLGAGSTASGTEYADEPLLNAGGTSSSGVQLGSLRTPRAPEALSRSWQAMKRYVGS